MELRDGVRLSDDDGIVVPVDTNVVVLRVLPQVGVPDVDILEHDQDLINRKILCSKISWKLPSEVSTESSALSGWLHVCSGTRGLTLARQTKWNRKIRRKGQVAEGCCNRSCRLFSRAIAGRFSSSAEMLQIKSKCSRDLVFVGDLVCFVRSVR